MRKTFFCIDAHTCGNPVRLVTGGAPLLNGESMMEKKQHFLSEFDWIRRGLMFEPRGHDMMSGAILYPPSDPNNDIGILFIETSGCLPMCGHGTIGAMTIAIEEGIIYPKQKGIIRLETPAGLVNVTYQKNDKIVESVSIDNVASFLYTKDLSVNCSTLGNLKVDIAFGGNFYCIIDPQRNFNGIQRYRAEELIQWSREIRYKLNQQYTFEHPENKDINGLSHILWTGKPIDNDSNGRNAVFYGEKAIDRSPCGTGTSARMAQLYTKGMLNMNTKYIHESFIGSRFTGEIISETLVGGFPAIKPRITGWAKVFGYNQIMIDSNDPYHLGFQVI